MMQMCLFEEKANEASAEREGYGYHPKRPGGDKRLFSYCSATPTAEELAGI